VIERWLGQVVAQQEGIGHLLGRFVELFAPLQHPRYCVVSCAILRPPVLFLWYRLFLSFFAQSTVGQRQHPPFLAL
jgi:hypothetical protein